jgi:glyoxylase I family protein
MTSPPEITGFHHVTLSVSSLDASIAWYRDLLGFTVLKRVLVNGLDKAMLTRDGMLVTFVGHGQAAIAGPFNERRCGLDHLSFAVADRQTLDAWVARLDAAGVARGQVTTGITGDLVAFRDPDNIALEFYTRQ